MKLAAEDSVSLVSNRLNKLQIDKIPNLLQDEIEPSPCCETILHCRCSWMHGKYGDFKSLFVPYLQDVKTDFFEETL